MKKRAAVGEVSGRIMRMVRQMAEASGYSWPDFLRYANLPDNLGSDATEFVPWDQYAHLCDRFMDYVGGHDAFREVSVRWGVGSEMSYVFRLIRGCLSAEQVYRLFGPLTLATGFQSMFSYAVNAETADGSLVISIKMSTGFRGSLGWFYSAEGVLVGFPNVLGYPRARVEILEISDRHGVYRVFPPDMKPVWNRVISWFQTPLRLKNSLEIVQMQEATLRGQYEELARKSEDLAAVLQASVDGIVIESAGKVCFANPAFLRLAGTEDLALVVGLPLSVWFSADTWRSASGWDAEALLTQDRREYALQDCRGRLKTVSMAPPRAIRWQNQDSLLWMFGDIGEKRRVEMAAAEATEKEQRRIADDLHDGLGQEMTAIALQLKVIETQISRAEPLEVAPIARLVNQVSSAARHARDIAHGLAPRMVVDRGLPGALSWLCNHTAEMFGMQIELTFLVEQEKVSRGVTTDRSIAIYRAAQEIFSNARKHGHASRVNVQVSIDGQRLCVSFADNGSGFATPKKPASGSGLRILAQRIGAVGGGVTLESIEEHGVRIDLHVPFWDEGELARSETVERDGLVSPRVPGPARIWLIDDHAIVREGIARCLRFESELLVTGEAGSWSEVYALSREPAPDIAVVDLFLNGESGIELIRKLKRLVPSVKILAFTMGAEEVYEDDARRAGAVAFVSKDAPSEQLFGELRRLGCEAISRS